MIKIAKQTKRSKTAKSKTTQTAELSYSDKVMKELCALSDWITSYGQDSNLQDISLSTLYTYLRNPYKNIKNIRNVSKYLSYKHGILRDVCNLFKYLPTLNYHLSWSSFDDTKKIKKYEKKVYNFLEQINVKQFVRDGLYEVCELGTIVLCLRKDKYIQFLDLDNLRINKIRNGKWVIEFDLSTIRQPGISTIDITQIIESLPDEITLQKYNLYKNKGEDYRFVELNNCEIISINSVRNYPYGFPYSMGAWASLIQKEIINRVERSISDRLIKQILLMIVGTMGGDKNSPGSPVPKELINFYFDQIKSLLIKKEQGTYNTSNGDISGIGLATLPEFIKLENVKTDVTVFTKDLYEKISNDIYSNLGVSPALIYGGGNETNFSSASMNNEKLFRYIFGVLEQFENVINIFISKLLPSNLDCKFYFEKSTFLDKDKMINRYKELYQFTGIVIPWLESLTNIPYHFTIGQKLYQDKVLKLDDILNPPQNPFTTSGDESQVGRPNDDNSTNPNTQKGKANDSNSIPSPSD